MTIAAGYIRVSTPDQAKDGESLNTQREAITQYAVAKQWDLIELYTDEAVSAGAKKERPELKRLLHDANLQKFQALIVHRLSRFGRNARELLNNHDALKSAGVQIHFVKEQIDSSTTTGKLLLTVMAAIAEMERDIIKEQMSENKLARWKEGRSFVGSPPLGYRWNKDKLELEIEPAEASLYHRIVSMYLDLGLAYKDIAIRLTDEGIRGKKGGKIGGETIAYILKNPAYYGHLVVNRHEYEGKKRTGELKPDSEHITFPIPALISKTKWDLIQDRIEFNKKKGKKVNPNTKRYWLRDMLQCDVCGGRIKHKDGVERKDGSFTRYYRCYWSSASEKERKVSGRKKCPLPFIEAEEIEDSVFDNIIYLLTLPRLEKNSTGSEDIELGWGEGKSHFKSTGINGRILPSHLNQLADPARYDRQIEDLEKHITTLEKEFKVKERARERIRNLLDSDDFDQNEFAKQLNRNKDEMLRVEARLMEQKEKLRSTVEAKKNDQRLKDFLHKRGAVLKQIVDDLKNLAVEDKKTLIEGMVDGKITVTKGDNRNWALSSYPLRFNRAIFEYFIAEGKISSLDQDTPYHSS